MSAWVSKDGKGYRIDVEVRGARSTLRLKRFGIVTREGNEQCAVHIKKMLEALALKSCLPVETQNWVSAIDARLYAKLQKLGLLPPRRIVDVSLSEFMESEIRHAGTSYATTSIEVLKRAHKLAATHFGMRPMREIAVEGARGFRSWLRGLPGRTDGRMSGNTINKMCGVLKGVFRRAIEIGAADRNPFDATSIHTSVARTQRASHVEIDVIVGVLAQPEYTEEGILLALGRLGCLRIPSEIRQLSWTDIDLVRRVMHVTSPKTARCGKGSRDVPIFPELHRILSACRMDSSPWVLPNLRNHSNPGVRVKQVLKAVGVTPWPRLLHSLRTSCLNDWVKDGHGIKDVAHWAGHNVQTLLGYYVSVSNQQSAWRAANACVQGQGSHQDIPSHVAVTTPQSVHQPIWMDGTPPGSRAEVVTRVVESGSLPSVHTHPGAPGSRLEHGPAGPAGSLGNELTAAEQPAVTEGMDRTGLEQSLYHSGKSNDPSKVVTGVVTSQDNRQVLLSLLEARIQGLTDRQLVAVAALIDSLVDP